MAQTPWLTRVRVSNFRSLAQVDVRLRALTVLVGPNGAGKSNLLDALRFLSDAVATNPQQATAARGGVGGVLRRQPGSKIDSFAVEINVEIPWGADGARQAQATYGVRFAHRRVRGARRIHVAEETCTLTDGDHRLGFAVRDGQVDAHGLAVLTKRVEPDRLLLPLLASTSSFVYLFQAIESMRFYHLDARVMRQPEPDTEDPVLGPAGEHLADVLGDLSEHDPKAKARIDDYLSAVVPGLRGLDRERVGAYVSVVMRQDAPGDVESTFRQTEISDGTIRAAGVLAALFQPSVLHGGTSLVAIEEPETALHPAAAGVLFDALKEASQGVQVIATSQSADLLDRDDIDPAEIRVVTFDQGHTTIGELDEASARIVADHRLTLGELTRGNQLTPRPPE